ncbi:hypothetical protein P5E88_02925 [Clostridium perfringens]|nr:hypothetical protein [Clostridium perfringens]MDK0775515.1 hypothetical protein [Clostridium perfringens]
MKVFNTNINIFVAFREKVNSKQLSLFDEAEKNSDVKIAEPKLEEITYKRKKS